MKRTWRFYVLVGLGCYLLFLLATVPSTWLVWGMSKYSNGTIQLNQANGSLWRGTGKLVVFYPQTTPHDLGDAEWGINPLWLLTGRVQLRLQTSTPDTRINGKLRVGYKSFSLNDLEIVQPAQRAAIFYPAARLINPEGQLRFTTDTLSFDSDGVEGTATLVWRAAGSRFSNVNPLGDYRLEITGEGTTAKLKLSSERGDLTLAGQGQWQLQTGQLQFNGTATPKARKQELESLLSMLGKDRGNGMRSLVVNQRIPYPLLSDS